MKEHKIYVVEMKEGQNFINKYNIFVDYTPPSYACERCKEVTNKKVKKAILELKKKIGIKQESIRFIAEQELNGDKK